MENKPSAIDMAIAEIKNMIEQKKLKPGERFPAEREMARHLGVSRNTVRSALHYFEVIGLVTTKRGSGSYLVDDPDAIQKIFDARQSLEKYNIYEMLQARHIIEVGMVKIAAQNANREDKIRLRSALAKTITTKNDVQNVDDFMEHLLADYEFHREIARITHNPLIVELHASLKSSFMEATEAWKRAFEVQPNIANPAHTQIAEAIIRNDPEMAAYTMEKHLQYMKYLVDLANQADLHY